ncbi:dimethylmenaquinone methyltransferase [Kribbella hippodromi]|uniref:Putative 4-hydroxy-4-methyl-2-oxoglutarate aldolase n=1 Tax=Kribbella hippodromi TaxID=434347 RepID=A0ABN2E262_9ACTN
MSVQTTADAAWPIPVRGPEFRRADPTEVSALAGLSAATASAKLRSAGIRNAFIDGPRPLEPRAGTTIAGPAVTLQFMPQREDVYSGLAQETIERGTALWAVLETIQPGDVLVVQANGSSTTGCLGEMLVRYFRKRGGAGIVVDGCIRDAAAVRSLGVPIWCTGVTPNYASQSELFPWAYDVPIAAGGALVLPGDAVVADEDGAVVVPKALAAGIATTSLEHEEWEQFSRLRIEEGGRLTDYYPVSESNWDEYESWKAAQGADH